MEVLWVQSTVYLTLYFSKCRTNLLIHVAMPFYRQTMGLTGIGSGTGIIFIVYSLGEKNCFGQIEIMLTGGSGQIAAIPFCAYIADKFGRRMCICAGEDRFARSMRS